MLKTRNGELVSPSEKQIAWKGERPASSTPESLLRMKTVEERTGLSRWTINRLRREQRFPEPIHPLASNDKVVAWPSSVIDAWIAARCRGEAA